MRDGYNTPPTQFFKMQDNREISFYPHLCIQKRLRDLHFMGGINSQSPIRIFFAVISGKILVMRFGNFQPML